MVIIYVTNHSQKLTLNAVTDPVSSVLNPCLLFLHTLGSASYEVHKILQFSTEKVFSA
jgi:hypothetical protein